jgi:prepilin-type processing-associated H-X9-DG protein
MASKPYSQPHGWVVEILPFLDQDVVYQQYDFNTAWSAPLPSSNYNAIQALIPALICPTSPNAYDPAGRGIPNNRGPLDYMPFFQIDPSNVAVAVHPPADQTGHGVLRRGVHCRIVEITDGSSNTLLLAEDAGRNQQWINGQLYSGTTPTPFDEGGAWANCCLGGSVDYFRGWDLAANTYYGACAVNCTNAAEIYSFHTGGANILIADGSVHFLSQSADINVVAALITRNGNETLPGDLID